MPTNNTEGSSSLPDPEEEAAPGEIATPGDHAAISAGAGIRWLRCRNGLSARQLSARAGLSPSYVDKLERGEIEPSFRSFAKLALTLGMTPAEAWFLIQAEAQN